MKLRADPSALEVLAVVDDLLAGVVVGFAQARARLVDLAPGHSGRPVGSGDVGGGSGASHGDTLVERLIFKDDAKGPAPEARLLTEFDMLANWVVNDVVKLAPIHDDLGPRDDAVRRLAWARWRIRVLSELLRRAGGSSVPLSGLTRLHTDADRLASMVIQWSTDPVKPKSKWSAELASDDTEMWCTSCLRIGAREPRSERYPTLGLCRWCGDREAEWGLLPPLPLLSARQDGKRITSKMVDEALAAVRPPKRKRKRKHRTRK